MPDRRKLKLAKYNIDDDLYQELFYFCKRYKQREIEINSLYELTCINTDGMPKGNTVGSQTESKALRISKLKSENQLIEEAAEKANPYLKHYIIKNVTQGISYDYMNVPSGRKQFYESRRMFFKILSEKR